MKGFLIGCGALIALVVLLGLGIGIWCISVSNNEVRLRNAAAAQEKANEAVYDNVWKTIAQQANVKDDYKNDFKEVWAEIVKGQSEGARKGALSVFVNRHNPNFDSGLYKKLMTTIEGSRKEFTNNQKKLIDIKREHDNVRTTFPGNLICGSRPELQIKIVTSGRTNDAFDSGRDDDVNLRPGQKKEEGEKDKKK